MKPSYFFINSNAKYSDDPMISDLWFEKNIAITNGDRYYGELLGQFNPGDVLLLYVSGKGVCGIGKVKEKWDRKTYRKGQFSISEFPEYRIQVDWFKDLRKNPISHKYLKTKIGWFPRETVKRIKKDEEAIKKLIFTDSNPKTARLVRNKTTSKKGGGFGLYENNLKVERAAIKLATSYYRKNGWDVASVENERCGYDLFCTNGPKKLEIEVKGSSANNDNFIITLNEVLRAKQSCYWELFQAKDVFSKKPIINRFSSNNFLNVFSLNPIQFMANKK